MKKIKLVLNESLISNKNSDVIEDTAIGQMPDYQIIDITVIPDENYYPTIQSILIDLDEGNRLIESDNKKLDINILSETVNQKTGYSNSLFEFESSNHTITLSLVLQETDRRGIYKVEAYTTRGIKVFESNTYKPKYTIESYLKSLAGEYLIDKPLKEGEDFERVEGVVIDPKELLDFEDEYRFYADDKDFNIPKHKIKEAYVKMKRNGYVMVNGYQINDKQQMNENTVNESDEPLDKKNPKDKEAFHKFAEKMKRLGFLNIKDMTSLSDNGFMDKLSFDDLNMFNKLENISYQDIQDMVRKELNEAEDPIKDDVKEDLAIEPGSDEEQMLDEIYEEPEEDKYSGAEDTYKDDTYEKTEPDDYSVEEFVTAQRLTDELMDLNIDYSEWNNMSQDERFNLVRPEIERFVNSHRNEFNKNPKLFDLVQYNLADANFHTEAKVMRDIYKGGKNNE